MPDRDITKGPRVAIIGGGIVGLHLALGLLHRGVQAVVYEQARELREIGAGLGLSYAAIKCQSLLDPRLRDVVEKVCQKSNDHESWVYATTKEDLKQRPPGKLADLHIDNSQNISGQYHFCLRFELLQELVNLLPPDCIHLRKRLKDTRRERSDGKVDLLFEDGTQETADAVIGCDGLKSRLRELVLPEGDPSAQPHYAQESAYRGLIDMDKAKEAIGNYSNTFMVYLGPSISLTTYPVGHEKFINFVALIRDKESFSYNNQPPPIANKKDIAPFLNKLNPMIHDLIQALPDQVTRWSLFDSFSHPLATYAYGNIVLAGDAAHASTPHHGAGASMGIEDALALSMLVEEVVKTEGAANGSGYAKLFEAAFQAYDMVRRERTQWLVVSSRRQGSMSKLEDEEIGTDREKFLQTTRESCERAYNLDIDGMERDVLAEFHRLASSSA